MSTAAPTITPEEKEAARKAARAKAERERRAKKKAEAGQASAPAPAPAEAPAAESAPAEPRGRTPKDPDAVAVLNRAKEIAPEIKSPYQPHEVRSLMTILGNRNPIKFAFDGHSGEELEAALLGRTPEEVLTAWTHGELETRDPGAILLRAKARELSKHPEAKNLWGRKVGALLLALEER